jgi:hypothetical protein
MRRTLILFVFLASLSGCAEDGESNAQSGEVAAAPERAGTAGAATVLGDVGVRLSAADLEAGRLKARHHRVRHFARLCAADQLGRGVPAAPGGSGHEGGIRGVAWLRGAERRLLRRWSADINVQRRVVWAS